MAECQQTIETGVYDLLPRYGGIEESYNSLSNSLIHYTAHHNWLWVLNAAVHQLCNDRITRVANAHLHNSCKDLPSQSSHRNKKKNSKVKYALFRVEIMEDCSLEANFSLDEQNPSKSVWATSLAFAFLDPKDALYRELVLQNAGNLMPKTSLLGWDIDSLDEICVLPSSPALLKASLGSGGFGLYFVNSREDVLSIIRAHAARARSFDGFLDSLRRDYDGNVPCWSLQSFINSYRVDGISNDPRIMLRKENDTIQEANINTVGFPCTPTTSDNQHSNNCRDAKSNDKESSLMKKRCQIRVYVVCSGRHLHMYNTFEARMPSWDVDLDEVLTPASTIPSDSKSYELNNFAPPLQSDNKIDHPIDPFDNDESISKRRIEENQIILDKSTNSSEEKIFTVDEFEEYCCSTSSARPYNKERNKSVTERFVFDELDDLIHARNIVGNCVKDAMIALKDPILRQMMKRNSDSGNDSNEMNGTYEVNGFNSSDHQEMAIAGIDLMLEISEQNPNSTTSIERTPELTAYILEINNNPAMAGEEKKMSVKYREHLISFVKNILLLGLSENMAEGFEIIW